MKNGNHLKDELLVKALDDELSEAEAARVGLHLSNCDECSRKYSQYRSVSNRLEGLMAGIATQRVYGERESLKKKLDPHQGGLRANTFDKGLRRFGWGMAIAATLAIGITLAPRTNSPKSEPGGVSQDSGIFEVDGETFVPLPYSNADLPLTAPHILQMRVPASSLASAGITVGPMPSEMGTDRSVLADVLVGTDGQPLGVHVVEE
ncbi:MAG: zf-HC2 domain-containing protein [Acidobacteriaceae bacterium]|nr:zf-HC2 domain-containing protein [Acidobacteriaceae bacterium]MBV9778711.1 zf-HC2 domain-containing protein [Acidobacteriaceae bacterium]